MSDTLLLNSDHSPISILPLSVIDWQHAIKLIWLGRVTVIDTYPDRIIRSERVAMNVPSICVTRDYFHYKKNVKFSRGNLYLRDLFKCQYCGEFYDYEELTIDHVLPKMHGGDSSWGNTVTSCKPCNQRKGAKLIKPLNKPYKPDYYNLINKWKSRPIVVRRDTWYDYLGIERPVP